MKPTFNVREQSEIYIGPTADILSGVLPEGRVITIRCWRRTTRCSSVRAKA